jgi:hypothetical protein
MARTASLILLPLLAFLGGCPQFGPSSVRELADGRIVPNRWSGAVKPVAQERATRPVHYDSLYVTGPTKLNVSPRPGWPETWATHWFRFWDGGQVMEKYRQARQPTSSSPSAADADFRGLATGVGRYSVVGDRIHMEFVGFDEGGWKWSRYHGRINEDGSFTLEPRKEPGYAGPLPPADTYRRLVVEGIRRLPDW